MIKFNRIILGDRMIAGMVGQAAKEKFLDKDADPFLSQIFRSSRNKHNALALLVLFDKVLLPDFDTNFHIPILEDSGVLEVVPCKCTLHDPTEVLARTVPIRPFVLNRMMQQSNKHWIEVARIFNLSRRVLYNSLIDFLFAYFRGDVEELNKNFVSQSGELSKALLDELFDKTFAKGGKDTFQKEGTVTDMQFLYLMLVAAVDDVETYQRLSEQNQAPVATKLYAGTNAGWTRVSRYDFKLETLLNTFHLVRLALSEERFRLPVIENIQHALLLRKDPNLRAFREQLSLFQSHAATGDKTSSVMLRSEVSKAASKLKQSGRWTSASKFVTYFSLPANLVETFVTGVPIVGVTLSLFSFIATMTAEHIKRKNEWVLFDR